MPLAAEIKKAMFAAMKEKNTVEKEVLRTALGEITKTGEEPNDDEVRSILKKMIKSNREAQAATSDDDAKATLDAEIVALEKFLPQALSVERIQEALSPVADQIKAAPNEGPAMGIAMKTLKASGAEVNSPDVKQAVAAIRG